MKEEEENSPCLPPQQSQLVFQTMNLFENRWKLKEKRPYLCLVEKLHTNASQDPPVKLKPDTFTNSLEEHAFEIR